MNCSRQAFPVQHYLPSLLKQTGLSDFPFTFHFHALEKEMATHSSVLAWRIPGTGEPGGLPSVGAHSVGHDWCDLAAAACLLSQWRHLAISCSVTPFSYPASGSFPVSWLFSSEVWKGLPWARIKVSPGLRSFPRLFRLLEATHTPWIVSLQSHIFFHCSSVVTFPSDHRWERVSSFKDLCYYTGPTWMIQDHLITNP